MFVVFSSYSETSFCIDLLQHCGLLMAGLLIRTGELISESYLLVLLLLVLHYGLITCRQVQLFFSLIS